LLSFLHCRLAGIGTAARRDDRITTQPARHGGPLHRFELQAEVHHLHVKVVTFNSSRFYLDLGVAAVIWATSFSLDKTIQTREGHLAHSAHDIMESLSYTMLMTAVVGTGLYGCYIDDPAARRDALTGVEAAGLAVPIDELVERATGRLRPFVGAILRQYPTAQAFRALAPRRLARLNYDERHQVGEELARKLIDAAKSSVGSQHSPAHRYACEDLQTFYVNGIKQPRPRSPATSTVGFRRF
jgi:hypothetical protein